MIRIDDGPDGARIELKVSPGASRDAFLGEYDGRLRVAVRQPPEKGRANAGVQALLARRLGVSKRDVEVVAGETSPRKTVLIRGVSADTIRKRIEAVLREDSR